MSVFDDMDRLHDEMNRRSTEALLAEAIHHMENAQKGIEPLGSVRVVTLILDVVQKRIAQQIRESS